MINCLFVRVSEYNRKSNDYFSLESGDRWVESFYKVILSNKIKKAIDSQEEKSIQRNKRICIGTLLVTIPAYAMLYLLGIS